MKIYRTLTEHTNGRVADPLSPTGWKRRAGVETYDIPGKRRPGQRSLWEPCDPPTAWVYGTADTEGSPRRGGTVHTVIEGLEAVEPFTLEETEIVIRRHASRYNTALGALNNPEGYSGVFKGTADDAFREASIARQRVLDLTGVDLDDTNVAFPYRLLKPTHEKPFVFEGEYLPQNEHTPAIF